MTHEQQLLASMAAKQMGLAMDFKAVGELSTARYMFGRAIEKLELAKQADSESHDVLDDAIAIVREKIAALSSPVTGQKGTSSLLENQTNQP